MNDIERNPAKMHLWKCFLMFMHYYSYNLVIFLNKGMIKLLWEIKSYLFLPESVRYK